MTDEKEQQRDKRNRSRAGAESKQSNYSNGDARQPQKKEYFQEELKRLRGTLEREGSKIHKPQRKAYTPYTFTTLEPYYNTVTQSKVIDHEPKEPKGFVPRKTAIGLCDPWVDHKMDVELIPKPAEPQEAATPRADDKGYSRQGQQKKGHKAGGSTRLPKFPAVQMPTGELATKPLNYGDVPLLRQELKTKYGSNATKKVDEEYERTKNDFYRMELDKLEEYHPINREHMTQAYMAYLQNNPGSRKAIQECIVDAKKDLDEAQASSRPQSAVSRPRSAVSQRPQSSRSRASVQQQD